MRTRRICRHVAERLPDVGFGAAPLGGLHGDAVGADEARAMVREAIAGGMTLFDTSPYYGDSEACLGEALAGVPRGTYALCTKGGRVAADVFDYSPAALDASLARSLRRLRTDYVDIFLLHDVEFAGDAFEEVIMETALPHIARCFREQGTALAVGLSCLPLATVRRALAHPNAALLDVVLSYSHHTLADDTLGEVRPLLDAAGVTLLDASPLSMGLLTTAGPQPWHPAPPPVRAACRQAAAELKGSGRSLEDVALTFALRQPVAPCLLLGSRTLHELRANMRCMRRAAGAENASPRQLEDEARVRVLLMRAYFVMSEGRSEYF
jgi:L-galactose dehydrogenase